MVKTGRTFFYLVCACLWGSCGQQMLPHIDLVEVPTVYTWKGAVKEYRINPEKKKIVSYFGSLNSLEFALEYTDPGKIDKIIRENPDFQFLFYVGNVQPEDTTAFKEMMIKYRCAFPVMLDFEDAFYKVNEPKLKGKDNTRMTIGYICDKDCRVYDVSVIGTRMSYFDERFRKAKRKM